jgi:hypothetical protein
VSYWWRNGGFGNDEQARGAFELAYMQGMDGMGQSVLDWMGLSEGQLVAWTRDKSLIRGSGIPRSQEVGGGRVNLVLNVRYVRIPVFEALTGYTVKAIQKKIEEGKWLEGREYRKAPDGHIVVDLEGYEKWVEGR